MTKLVDYLKNEGKAEESKKTAIKTEAQISEDLFRAYKSSRQSWETQAKEDEDFRRGAQWTPAEEKVLKERGQAPIVVNVIEPAVDQAKALLTTNKPRFSSTAREDSDVKTGKIFADIMSYIWDISNGHTQLKQAVDDYYVKGVGYLVAYIDWWADNGKGEVKIVSEDPYNVYVDPNSKDPYIRDAAHVLIVKKLSEEQIEATFPQWERIKRDAQPTEEDHLPESLRHGEEEQNVSVSDAYHTHYQVIERYTKVRIKKHVIYNPETADEKVLDDEEFMKWAQEPAIILVRNSGQPEIITDEDMVEEFLNILQNIGPIYHIEVDPTTGQKGMVPGPEQGGENEEPNSTVGLQPITQMDALEMKGLIHMEVPLPDVKKVITIGKAEYSNELLKIDNHPIVSIMNHHNRTPYPMSDVRFVRGIQEQINKIESLIIAHAANSTNVKVFLPNGAVDREEIQREFAKAGSGVMYFEASIGAPVIAAPVALPNELYKNKADKIAEIEKILGIYALMQGDQGQAPNTYKGTIALDEFGQRRIKSKKDDIEMALNVLAAIVVQLIQQVYTTPKIMRLILPNNKIKEISINQEVVDLTTKAIKRVNDVTTGKYDIILVSGSMLPSNRWALVEYYMELYKLNLLDQQSVLEKTEVADVEEVLERVGIMQQQARMIAELQEKVKDLEGDLQTAVRESLHDKKRVEVANFKIQLAKSAGDVQKAAQLYEAGLQMDRELQDERFSMMMEKEKLRGKTNG